MAISDHVSITITVDTVGIARASFGIPLIISYQADFSGVRTYSSLAEVASDFSATDGPEYLAAQALFSQSPHPSKLKIAAGTLAPTLNYACEVVTARNSHTYQILVKGEGVTETTVEFESDTDATVAEVGAGLVAALNNVTGKNFTATDNEDGTFDVTGDSAGDWFSLEILDRTDLAAVVDHADPGVATDLAAIKLADNEWYELLTLYNSSAYVLAAAAWVESNKKRYRADCSDTTALTDAVESGTDLIDDLATQGYERTMGCYHPDPSEFFACAWAGRVLPIDPGKIIDKFKTLAGISTVTMTSTERSNLVNKRGNSYESAGVDITFNGMSAMDGRFFDTVRDRDALEDDVQKSVMEAIASGNKVEFSDAGVAIVEAAVRGALRRNTSNESEQRILAASPVPTVTVPKVADVSTADKTARTLPDVKFSGTLGGGIHSVEVTGSVSL